MLNYLMENYIDFFEYLEPHEINNLTLITSNFASYFPNNIWKKILLKNENIQQIKLHPDTISLVHSENYVTTLDLRIIPSYIHPYKYICLHR